MKSAGRLLLPTLVQAFLFGVRYFSFDWGCVCPPGSRLLPKLLSGWPLLRGSTHRVAMCAYFLLELLGCLPGPCPQWNITGWFAVVVQWLHLPEALLLRQIARNCCRQLTATPWHVALHLAARQLESMIGVPASRFRSVHQNSLAWRLWHVGRDLRLFPQCREAACIAAYCTQVVRYLVHHSGTDTTALAPLDTYG